MSVHLHRDYSTSHCGLDISYLPATLDEGSVTCAACQTGLAEYQEQQEQERAAVQAELEADAAMRAAAQMASQERARLAAEAAENLQTRMRRIEEALGLDGSAS